MATCCSISLILLSTTSEYWLHGFNTLYPSINTHVVFGVHLVAALVFCICCALFHRTTAIVTNESLQLLNMFADRIQQPKRCDLAEALSLVAECAAIDTDREVASNFGQLINENSGPTNLSGY